MVHGSISIPGKTERDEVVITTDEIAASSLDYLALGHWHSAQTAKAGNVTYAYSGAPEAVALDQDRAGKALLVELDDRRRAKSVTVRERQVGRDPLREGRDRRRDGRQPAGPRRSCSRRAPTPISSSMSGWPASAATTSTSTSTRSRPRSRRIVPQDPRPRCLRPRPDRRPLPSPDTIAGAFIRDLEARIGELEAAGVDRRGRRAARRAPPRPAAARRARGLPVRVRKLSGRDFRRYRTFDIDFAPGLDRHPRPERGRQDAPSSGRSSSP